MKKLSLLLICILIFSFTGCGNKSSESTVPEETAPTKIILTTENIEDYLIITRRYGKIEKEPDALGLGFYSYSSEFFLNMEPAISGSFENVFITFEIKFANGWYLSAPDHLWSESEDYIYTRTVRLSSMGSLKEIYNVYTVIDLYDVDPTPSNNKNQKFKITSVSGNFIPS